ncbi:Imm8 family immunity protein [Gilliamella sp. ESL0250]|uniref:Imm8 family immunity protein n=1 Tax=Gilliamella sp. ESL0250 TaxID=2705036 RepID=UPI00157FC74C|nr:hypothetical protein [Gilliamella sp. ESL0250]
MKIILKSFGYIDDDPTIYIPEENDNFCITLNLSIGLADSNEADYFDVMVCTPKWLLTKISEPELLRYTLSAENCNFLIFLK